MIQLWVSAAVAVNLVVGSQPFPVQFGRGISGHPVQVSIDGRPAKTTFAGKLVFRDQNRSWQSLCADVRAPISDGQVFAVRFGRTKRVGGNVAKAGNIVAKYFHAARTADQCAGLQLAVWEAVEDGGPQIDLATGRFRAMGTRGAMMYAAQYYEAIEVEGVAAFLEAAEGGQSQITPIM